MLSKQAIIEFQKIYKKEFGVLLSFEEASAQGTKLLQLFKLLYQPVPKKWMKKVKRTNKT